MTYDFDCIIDRRTTECMKWRHYDEDVLPMWVADMDFRSPEPVIQALQARVEHGVFGYEGAPPALRAVIAARLKRLYDWDVAEEAIVFLPGVVPAFNVAIQTLLNPGEGLLIQTPVYPPILRAARIGGVESHAMALTQSSNGRYTIDFDLFANTISDRTRMFLLCNPHNPVGRVFDEAELARMADLCLHHDLLICSDEIHSDFIYSGHKHRPIAALSPEIAARTITLMAPSKTFNIAGLHAAFAIIPDDGLRQRFNTGRRGILGTVNVLGYTAALAAYEHGQPWLDALLAYLEANRDYAVAYIRQHMPSISVAAPEGTYLAWLDCRGANLPADPSEFFLDKARVSLNNGATFGPGGEGFVRLNFGCPRALLTEGLERMRRAMENLG